MIKSLWFLNPLLDIWEFQAASENKTSPISISLLLFHPIFLATIVCTKLVLYMLKVSYTHLAFLKPSPVS